MSKSTIEELIEKANRDNIDQAESRYLYHQAEGHCRNFHREIIKTALYFYMTEKFKLYEHDDKKNARDLLRSWSYSDGAISHLMAYGEFCCLMKFTDEQLPPEYIVRQILTKELRDNWCDIYRAACELASKKYVEHEYCKSEKFPETGGNVDGDDDSENLNSENQSENAQIDGEDPTDPDDDDPDDDPDDDDDDDDDEDEDEDALNENSLPFAYDSASSDCRLSIKPSIREIQQAVRVFKMNDSKTIYLFSIGEKMPRKENFTSAVLEKFKDKLKSVTVLCEVVNDFKSSGGMLTENDTTALVKFCAEIHALEKENLQNAINGNPEGDDGVPAEDVKE